MRVGGVRAMDQRRLGSAHRVRSVRRGFETNLLDPGMHDAGVLPSAQVGRSFAASTISAIDKGLDEGLAKFAQRRLSSPAHALYNVRHAHKEPLAATFATTTAIGPANEELDFGCATRSTRGVISLHTVLVSGSEWPDVG